MRTPPKKEMFEPDANTFKYTIQIDVYDNVCQTSFKGDSGKTLDKVSFHEVIGVLESQKQHLLWTQRERNLAKKIKRKNR